MVKWLPQAEADLINIEFYIAQDDILTAVRVGERIYDLAEKIEDNNKIGRTGRVRGTRERVVTGTKYIIVYQIKDRIEIIRVLHGAQMWPSPEVI